MKFEPIIKWSGSKRNLSQEIISYFPETIDTYYEPFCGSCSVLFQLLHSKIVCKSYICSDSNPDLINYFNLAKLNPLEIFQEYQARWNILSSYGQLSDRQKYYYEVRDKYNQDKSVHDFVFLTRTSANGLVRYNLQGKFNAPFNSARNGINPDKFKKIIFQWSEVLNKFQVKFLHQEYQSILPSHKDFIFLDPPYPNTTGMYYGGIDLESFWETLLNYPCNYAFTFDGKGLQKDRTYQVPSSVYDKHIYLNSQVSGFKKIHNDIDYISESLYLKI